MIAVAIVLTIVVIAVATWDGGGPPEFPDDSAGAH